MTNTVQLSQVASNATTVDTHRWLLAEIDALAPLLEAEADKSEALGRLTDEQFAAMKALKLSTLFIPRDLGGYEFSPTQALEIFERITYYDGAAGWVSFVHACAGGMAAGYLPKSATDVIFAPGTTNIICGVGAPTGFADKVEGGYRVTGKWSYGSGIEFADYAHTGAVLRIDGVPQVDAKGRPVVICVHPSKADIRYEGNWDVLGLQGTGSIDYSFDGAFCPEDHAFLLMSAEPRTNWGFFQLGVVGISAIGHSGFAVGTARRMLDELAEFARSRSGRADMMGQSDAFWEGLAKAEGKVRSARAFLFEAWRDAEVEILADRPLTTRQMTLLRLALYQVHQAGAEACEFAYRAAGGAALRKGKMQKLFREMYVAIQHMTVAPAVLRHCGRELMGGAPGQVWRFYEVTDPD